MLANDRLCRPALEPRVELKELAGAGRQVDAQLEVVRAEGGRRIVSEGREKDRYLRRASRGEHAADGGQNRLQVAADLLVRIEPEAGHVDHDQGRPLAEPNPLAPAAPQVTLAQLSEVLAQRAAQLVGQAEISGTEGRRIAPLGGLHCSMLYEMPGKDVRRNSPSLDLPNNA